MTENLSKKPKRGILKQSSSFEQRDLEHHPHHHKNPHFDEKNILETLHPADKDYGFMKIEEPKTPYEYETGIEEAEEEEAEGNGEEEKARPGDELDAELLAHRIASECANRPRRHSEPSGDEEDLKLLSPEEREHRRQFEQKRKKHYNEFYAVKMARELMATDDEDDDEEGNSDVKAQSCEEGNATTGDSKSASQKASSAEDMEVSEERATV